MAVLFANVLILSAIVEESLTPTNSNLEIITAEICDELWSEIEEYKGTEFDKEDLFEFILERIDSIARGAGLIRDQ
jgi:hypothetical protein